MVLRSSHAFPLSGKCASELRGTKNGERIWQAGKRTTSAQRAGVEYVRRRKHFMSYMS